MSAWAAAGIGAVVLAAGRSSRMTGGSKLLLPDPRDGAPLVRHAVVGVLALAPVETVVVVRPDLPEVVAALADLPVRLVPNPDYQEGMATSLRVGIGVLSPAVAATLVLLGDTPDVDPAVFAALLAAYEAAGRPITQPVFDDTPGPPTLFARAAFPALAMLTGDQGGRQVIRQHPDWLTRVPLPAALQPPDIDTPEDYRAYTERRQARGDRREL